MPKLKNRANQIPYGFQFYQPQTQWTLAHDLSRSFEATVKAISDYRIGNPGLAKQHGLSLDREDIANELDQFNAQRMLAREWNHFITDESNDPKHLPPHNIPLAKRLQQRVQGVAGAAETAREAALLLAEWLGEGGMPVGSDLSNKRANVCLNCPHNVDPNWIQKLGAGVAKKVMLLLSWKHQLSPPVEQEGKLMTCGVCDCHLPLKVVVPIKHIINGTDAETMMELKTVLTNAGEKCWVVTESEA